MPPPVPALTLDLPQASSWFPIENLVSVQLTADGKTLFDDRPLDGDEAALDATLRQRFREARAVDRDVRAVILADAAVPHGRVVHILDLVNQGGIHRVAFAVKPLGDGAPAAPVSPSKESEVRIADPPRRCSFPDGEDAKDIEDARVRLVVAVDAAGTAKWVRILDDPGFGFGQAATKCALEMTYLPKQDAQGTPIASVSRPIVIRFQR